MTDYRNQFLLFSDILSGENVFRLLTIHKYFNTFYFRASEMCLKNWNLERSHQHNARTNSTGAA